MVQMVLASSLLVLSRADLSKVSLADVDPQAVCSDGSSAAYYYKPGTETSQVNGSGTWLVYLQGGGWCYDEKSCKERCGDPSKASDQCSSREWESTIALGGIFQPAANNELRNAHKVFVRYCTSDAHMGNGEAFGFQFRGQVVVQAVLQDLVKAKGLGSGFSRLIFGGGSAGARGAMVHLDYVKGMLGEAASSVDVVGFLDSPAWIDKPSYRSEFPGFPSITQQVHRYANVKHLGMECSSLHSGLDEWKCMYGQYRLPTLQTPYFLVASQYDSYQLSNAIGAEPVTESQLEYANDIARATRELGLELSSKDGVAVFSWACYNHAVSADAAGFNSHTCDPNGTTMDAAFERYMAPVPAGLKLYQDQCDSFGCGHGCSTLAERENADPDLVVEVMEDTQMVVV